MTGAVTESPVSPQGGRGALSQGDARTRRGQGAHAHGAR